jgi:uroporphyrin-III C-methyltransferase/precorrin-2 dehydrogenase/sirohydrochlorin ferrochelatase
MSAPLFPLFLKLDGRRVLVAGGGAMAAQRVRQLAGAGARVVVVAPEVRAEIEPLANEVLRRPFRGADVDGAWLVIAAATPEVNRAVAAAAEARGVFVNAVDDPATASAYCGGIVRRAGALVAVSTEGRAPALAALLREGIEALLPVDLERWMARAEELRGVWKRARVAMVDRRPMLLAALNELYAGGGDAASEAESKGEPTPTGLGFVSLVGAGPGDPDLLTVKAVRRLGEADLVLYDALVNGEVLRLAPKAHCFFVGKRAGRPSIAQETIHRMLVDAARLGKRVVRLKCGDPFVLGRGGEEALALQAAGIPYEVVPGLSSALAAPALAGIPVTHRGIASGFAVVSGHAPESFEPVLRSLEPGSLTVVILMGLAHRRELASALLARGWSPATPAAIAFAASTPAATTWVGTLAALAAAPVAAAGDAPGTIVVGGVVSVARNSDQRVLREQSEPSRAANR